MESLKMWTLKPILFLMLLTSSFGMDSISELLRTHPTWSFELRSVESLIQNGMKQLRNAHAEFDIPEDTLRRKIENYVRPGETHVVFKTGDPKWPKRVPQSFDARDHFKECAHLIGDMEDEGPCYNDVHVTVASVATDRYCIYTNGTFKGRLSSEYLTGCYSLCTNFQTIYHTWDQVVEFGLPSGGKYSSNEGCLPYVHEPCKHTATHYTGNQMTSIERSLNGKRGSLKLCDEYMAFDHDCPAKCSNSKYPILLKDDFRRMTTHYQLPGSEYVIKSEIYMNGPVSTDIFLYSDFFNHKGGFYNKTSDAELVKSDKLVKLIGWGEEADGKRYWLAVNSWAGWGNDNKVFKFPRGVNFLWSEWFVTCGVYDPL